MSLSTQDALIYLMVISATSDAAVSEREMQSIAWLVTHLPVFEGFELDRLGTVVTEAVDLIKDSSSMTRVLDMVLGAVPQRLHDTAYALAVEVTTVDLQLEQSELRLLEMVRDALRLDNLVSAAIEASARARLRKA